MGRYTLRQHRLLKGYTQEEMAKILEVHRNTYVSWEENPDKISVGNAKRVAITLGMSVNDIFFEQ
jgi:DNA-binding XRE family transcriptional regulator